MKPILLLFCFHLVALAQQTPDNAKPNPSPDVPEASPNPKAKPNKSDPFLRGSTTSPVTMPKGPLVNLYGLLEYIEVPRDLWLGYSGEMPAGSNATALRAEVQSWVKAGKAKPIEMTCVPTRNGQRTVVESIIERRYPDSYNPEVPFPVPETFEVRNTGITFEWEPVIGPDLRTLDVSLAPSLVRMAGSSSAHLLRRKANAPSDAERPNFLTHKATLSISSQSSQAVLLDTITPLGDSGDPRDDVRWLIFFRGAPVQPAKPAKEPDSNAVSKSADQGPTVLSFELERLEVSIADLNAWFAGKDLDAGVQGLRIAALDWIRSGRGRVSDRRTGTGKSGKRHVLEPIHEISYPNQYFIEPTVGPGSFEVRNTGYTVEMEPTLTEDGRTVDLAIVAQDVRHKNEVMFPQTEVDGKPVPAIEQPIFYTLKVSTTLFTVLGQPSLLVIATPSNEKAEPDPQWRVLTFITFRK